jgi:uncharacterized protein (DUF3820 family)
MDDLEARMRADLEEIGRTHMPFGKYGPQHFPPSGIPIYDIPAEYLGWFANKAGFPKGRLGVLLKIVHQMKSDGSDIAFDVFRGKHRRTALRPEKQKSWRFDPPEASPPPSA